MLHAEIERKYTVDGDTAVPDLSGLGAVTPHPTVRMRAVYLDTETRALLDARIALRRREGGQDEGWHLKLPGAGGRLEVQVGLEESGPNGEVPTRIAEVIASLVRGRPLIPIAEIVTHRTATDLADGGAPRIEFVDDLVEATDVATGTTRAWREWEAEQVGDDRAASAELLERTDALLKRSGAVRSASPAKLAQALGLVGLPASPPRRAKTAGQALDRAIEALVADLHRAYAGVVIGEPEAVHDMRTTVRRLRTALRQEHVVGPDRLGGRLRDLGGALAGVRDLDVAADSAERLIGDLPSGTTGVTDAERRLVTDVRAAAARAADALHTELGSPAVLRLFADLESVPPSHGDRSRLPAAATIRSATLRAARKSVHAYRKATDIDGLHASRKAGRRVHHLADLPASPPRRLRRLGRRGSSVQKLLGEHRDMRVFVGRLIDAASAAGAAGEDTSAYAALAELALDRADSALRDARGAVRDLAKAARQAR